MSFGISAATAAVVGGGLAAAGSIGSAIIGSNASKNAANAQQQAADSAAQAQLQSAQMANDTQRYFYDTTRRDNLPAIQTGNAARNQLSMLMGLDVGAAGGGAGPSFNSPGRDALNSSDLVQYVNGVPTPNYDLYYSNPAYRWAWDDYSNLHKQAFGTDYTNLSNGDQIEQSVRERLMQSADRDAAEAAANPQPTAKDNPLFNSLNKQFTTQDFWNDPGTQLGFQFGLDQGTQGLNRQAAANGNLNSGATLKALTRYATDYTGTKYGDAWNRDQTLKGNQYNRLASLAGVGQSAVNTVSNAGQSTANQMGSNSLYGGTAQANAAYASGNARANSAIGTGNAINSALGFGANYLTNNWGGGGSSSSSPWGSGQYASTSGVDMSNPQPYAYLS